jgi:hypothetical protein
VTDEVRQLLVDRLLVASSEIAIHDVIGHTLSRAKLKAAHRAGVSPLTLVEELIARCLVARPDLTSQELAEFNGLRSGDVSSGLGALVRRGFVTCQGRGLGSRHRLSPVGLTWLTSVHDQEVKDLTTMLATLVANHGGLPVAFPQAVALLRTALSRWDVHPSYGEVTSPQGEPARQAQSSGQFGEFT